MSTSSSTTEQDARAFNYYNDAINSVRTIKLQIDALVKAGEKKGTRILRNVEHSFARSISDYPTMLVSRLVREVENEERDISKHYNNYRAATSIDDKNRALVSLRCCNIPFHVALWREAKRCNAVLGFRGSVSSITGSCPKGSDASSPALAKIDILAENGAQWVRILTITQKNLLQQMGNAGWDWDYEGDDLNLAILASEEEVVEVTGIEPVDVVRKLIAAAKTTRASSFNYQSPSIRLVLSRVKEGLDRHVDQLARVIEALGTKMIPVTVDLVRDDDDNDDEPLENVLLRMMPTYDSYLSQTVNLDCTVLFNLTSDISHYPPETYLETPQFNVYKEDFLDETCNGPRLLKDLYPAIRGRHLVCTEEAANNLRQTILSIGAPNEIKRLQVILPTCAAAASATPDPPSEEQRLQAISGLRALSSYQVPDDLILPVTVVKAPTEEDMRNLVGEGKMPQIVADLVKHKGFKKMSRSTIWYAMANQVATLTCNLSGLLLLSEHFEGHGGIGQRRRHFVPIMYGRRLAGKPRPEWPQSTAKYRQEGNGLTGQGDPESGESHSV